MNTFTPILTASVLLAASAAAAPSPAAAAPAASPSPAAGAPTAVTGPATPASPLHFDLEVDPTAYALHGHSLHIGVGYHHLRVDLGNYAEELPQFLHADDGFDLSFRGYGTKVQIFPFAEQHGLVVGIDAGVSTTSTHRQGTEMAVEQHLFGVGADIGYRIALGRRFYVTPWIGASYNLNARDVTLAGATSKANPLLIFPAIHVGYRVQ